MPLRIAAARSGPAVVWAIDNDDVVGGGLARGSDSAQVPAFCRRSPVPPGGKEAPVQQCGPSLDSMLGVFELERRSGGHLPHRRPELQKKIRIPLSGSDELVQSLGAVPAPNGLRWIHQRLPRSRIIEGADLAVEEQALCIRA